MKTLKNILYFLSVLLIISCGQNESPSSKAQAESNKLPKTDIEKTIPATQVAEKIDIAYAEKELIAESTNTAIKEKEKQKKSNVDSGNVENSNPAKVNQKKDKIKKLDVEKEEVEVIVGNEEIKPHINPENVTETKTQTTDKIAEKITPVVKQEPTPPVKEVVKEIAIFSHDSFNQLLQKHVSSSGKVNYNNLKAEEPKLDAYLKGLDDNPPASGWSKSKKMAYWINAYNAATIKLILKNYPISSITKLHGGKPWDQKWIPLGGKTYTLNNIENDILRPVYKDARIHFAVNCAAKSCPPLLNKAWTKDNLNKYLEQQTKAFINDKTQNTISADAIQISKIFEWYAADFGNIIDYLNKYSTTKINPDAKISYKDYNWDLNK